MNCKHIILLFLSILSTFSCSSSRNSIASSHRDVTKTQKKATSHEFYKIHSEKLDVQLKGKENKALITELSSWLGTPYKYAGETQRGADCSGFVGSVYKVVYNKKLHRRTRDMVLDVSFIFKSKLRAGDLVFFKINGKHKPVSHVGIYIANNKFIHASSSKGVIVSSLNNAYYKKFFYKAGRVK